MSALELRGHEFDEVAAAAGIAPLVVVPGQDFDAAVTDDFGVAGVDDGRVRIAFEIGGDEFFFRVREDSFHGAVGRGFQRGIDGLDGRGLFHKNGKVDDANVRRRHTHGVAIELALQLWNGEMQGLRGCSRTGNHVDGGRAGAAKILVRQIEKLLIVRVGVNSSHGAAVNAEGVLQNLCDRGEAICGARGVRNHVMLRRIVSFVVDAEDEGRVGAVGMRGDDHFFDRAAEMLLSVGAFGEETSRFDNDVGSDAGLIDFGGIFYRENLEGLAFNRDRIARVRDVVREIAEDGIVLEQVREGLCVGNVVDGVKLNILVVERGAHNVPPDAAEAVDADLYVHTSSDSLCETAAGSLKRNDRKAEPKMLGCAKRKVKQLRGQSKN